MNMAAVEKYSRLKAARISLRHAIPLPKPFTVLFEPASVCNFKCVCCFHNEPDIWAYLPKGLMKFDDFRKIADDLAAWEGDRLKVIRVIGFGEPLLNPHTPRMVKYLKNLDVADRIEITTNASLLRPALSQQLIESGLDYLRCSIYSVDQKRHEALTQNGISIEKIKSNIEVLKELRGSAGAAKPFIYVKMIESRDQFENALFLKEYSDIADEAALEKPHQWLSNSDASGKMRRVCPQPFKMLSIHFDGSVILCDPDWKGNTTVGNALSEKISSIWGGAKMRDFWRMQIENRRHENKSCRNCSFIVDEYAIDDLDGVSPEVLVAGRVK
jgi:radical SAM protein with 4Fe4S-binding SPASM domain